MLQSKALLLLSPLANPRCFGYIPVTSTQVCATEYTPVEDAKEIAMLLKGTETNYCFSVGVYRLVDIRKYRYNYVYKYNILGIGVTQFFSCGR